jgi:glycerol uptake facilitator-like aquaporin
MCGRKFDFEKKGGYYDGSRYICKSCGKMVKKQLVNESLTSGAVNGSWFAALFGILIGAALLFFQYYPQVKAKKQQKEKMESENRAIAEQVKFCKTCGARTKGLFCEYCGSKLD